MSMKSFKSVYRCCLQTVTPVHIGCDEVYEPTAFTVDEAQRHLTVVSPLRLIQSFSADDRTRFSAICRQGSVASILEIYKFLRHRQFEGRTVAVCSDFIGHYRSTLEIPARDERRAQNELNKFEIPRTAFRNGDGRAYIPGSSVKGALRTAYLNGMEQSKKLAAKGRPFKDQMQLQQALLDYRNIPGDPFRMVKVSDFQPVGPILTKIVYAVNQKKVPGNHQARGLPLLMEVILPGATFIGQISVEKPHPSADIQSPIVQDLFLQAARHFFAAEWERESSELAKIQVPTESFTLPKAACLLRCGRHSGAESVTVQGHRNIRIMGKRGERPKFLDHATTLWLASESRHPEITRGMMPFGWTVLAPLTTEIEEKCRQVEKAYFEKEGAYVSQSAAAPAAQSPTTAKTVEPQDSPPPIEKQLWSRASLTWDAGSETLTASAEGRKASTRDQNLIPTSLSPRLIKKGKKKAVFATVIVEPVGNAFQIVEIKAQ